MKQLLARRPRVAAAAAALAALASGCGAGGGGPAAPEAAPPDGAAALAQLPERLRAAGTVAFEGEFVETKEATPDRHTRYMSSQGALDLRASEGRNTVDLTWIVDELNALAPPGAPPSESSRDLETLLGEPIEVRWTAADAYFHVAGAWQRTPREQLAGAGLIWHAAEEPQRLLALLPFAEDVRPLGNEEVAGETTARVAFSVDARRAGRRGAPAELYGAFAQARHGPKLRFEAWLRPDGLPARLAYVISKDEVRTRDETQVVIPAKTIRVTYTLSRFGENLDTEPPDSPG